MTLKDLPGVYMCYAEADPCNKDGGAWGLYVSRPTYELIGYKLYLHRMNFVR